MVVAVVKQPQRQSVGREQPEAEAVVAVTSVEWVEQDESSSSTRQCPGLSAHVT